MVLLLFDGEAARFGAARTGCANADKAVAAAVLSRVRRVAVMGFPWLRLDRAIMADGCVRYCQQVAGRQQTPSVIYSGINLK